MSELSIFVRENGQLLMTGAALVLLLVLSVNQARLLGRMKKLQRNIDGITEKVGAYLAVVMDAEDGESAGADSGKTEGQTAQKNGRSEEDDSRLISAVLQEIFP